MKTARDNMYLTSGSMMGFEQTRIKPWWTEKEAKVRTLNNLLADIMSHLISKQKSCYDNKFYFYCI